MTKEKTKVTTGNKADSVKGGLVLITSAVTGFKAALQGIVKAEPMVAEAALYAVRHAKDHGDVTLADRLVKDIKAAVMAIQGKGKTHPIADAMLNELVAWFRTNSPIRWDAKGKCTIDKERGWKDKDLENAESEAFHETERAQNARDAMLKAQTKALEPMTMADILGRIRGLRRTFESALKADKNGVVRGVKRGEAPKIRKLLEAVEESAEEVTGQEIAPVEGPISERGRSKAAQADVKKKAAA